MKRRILIIDGDAHVRELLQSQLVRRRFDAITRSSCATGLACLDIENVALVITDLTTPGVDERPCWQAIVQRDAADVVVLTGPETAERAIDATRAGAYDFILRPVNEDALALTLQRGIEHRQLKDEVAWLRRSANPGMAQATGSDVSLLSMEAVEQRHVAGVLQAVRGNKALAARVLGMDRRTLYRKLDRWREAPSPT
jgi:DNA-binding NtrC family response regulator